MSHVIRAASSPADYAVFATLIAEYVNWLRDRYQDDAWFILEVLDKQSLASELQDLAAIYGPPQGRTFLAVAGDEMRGCGAYRRLADGSCEMKRLFVPTRYQGAGIGRDLARALIASAREDGFPKMRLDTGVVMNEALAMYASLGFTRCAPYYDYPAKLLPYLVFMEIQL